MRSMLVGPSGGGKTVLLINMILDVYRDCFSRVYIRSPSINVDSTWKPVKDYIRDHIKPSDREKCYFDSYEPSELEQVIKTQQTVTYYQKEQKHKYLYQILIVIDDFADDQFHKNTTTFTSVIHKRKTLYDFNKNINTGW